MTEVAGPKASPAGKRVYAQCAPYQDDVISAYMKCGQERVPLTIAPTKIRRGNPVDILHGTFLYEQRAGDNQKKNKQC